MKKIIFCLNCILNISFITAGFTGDTPVITPKGLVALQLLKVGDKVICYKGDGLLSNKSIQFIKKSNIQEAFKIITHGGDVIYSSKDARFLMPKEKQWNYASDLRPGNWLLQQNMEGVKVKCIEQLTSSIDIFDICVKKYHNFGVFKNGIIVHNFNPAILLPFAEKAVEVGWALYRVANGAKALHNAMQHYKDSHDVPVEGNAGDIAQVTIVPPDNTPIFTPIPKPTGPKILITPIAEPIGPPVLINPIPPRSTGFPGYVTPRLEPTGPKILITPIPRPTGPLILMQEKTPDQAPKTDPLEHIFGGAEREEKTGHGGPSTIFAWPKRSFEDALKDFNSLGLINIKPIDTGFTGTLPDGRQVTVRIDSDDGRPTLEVYDRTTKLSDKLRYGPKQEGFKKPPRLKPDLHNDVLNKVFRGESSNQVNDLMSLVESNISGTGTIVQPQTQSFLDDLISGIQSNDVSIIQKELLKIAEISKEVIGKKNPVVKGTATISKPEKTVSDTTNTKIMDTGTKNPDAKKTDTQNIGSQNTGTQSSGGNGQNQNKIPFGSARHAGANAPLPPTFNQTTHDKGLENTIGISKLPPVSQMIVQGKTPESDVNTTSQTDTPPYSYEPKFTIGQLYKTETTETPVKWSDIKGITEEELNRIIAANKARKENEGKFDLDALPFKHDPKKVHEQVIQNILTPSQPTFPKEVQDALDEGARKQVGNNGTGSVSNSQVNGTTPPQTPARDKLTQPSAPEAPTTPPKKILELTVSGTGGTRITDFSTPEPYTPKDPDTGSWKITGLEELQDSLKEGGAGSNALIAKFNYFLNGDEIERIKALTDPNRCYIPEIVKEYESLTGKAVTNFYNDQVFNKCILYLDAEQSQHYHILKMAPMTLVEKNRYAKIAHMNAFGSHANGYVEITVEEDRMFWDINIQDCNAISYVKKNRPPFVPSKHDDGKNKTIGQSQVGDDPGYTNKLIEYDKYGEVSKITEYVDENNTPMNLVPREEGPLTEITANRKRNHTEEETAREHRNNMRDSNVSNMFGISWFERSENEQVDYCNENNCTRDGYPTKGYRLNRFGKHEKIALPVTGNIDPVTLDRSTPSKQSAITETSKLTSEQTTSILNSLTPDELQKLKRRNAGLLVAADFRRKMVGKTPEEQNVLRQKNFCDAQGNPLPGYELAQTVPCYIPIKVVVELKAIPAKIVFDPSKTNQPSGLQFNFSNDKTVQPRKVGVLTGHIFGSDVNQKKVSKPTFVISEKPIPLNPGFAKPFDNTPKDKIAAYLQYGLDDVNQKQNPKPTIVGSKKSVDQKTDTVTSKNDVKIVPRATLNNFSKPSSANSNAAAKKMSFDQYNAVIKKFNEDFKKTGINTSKPLKLDLTKPFDTMTPSEQNTFFKELFKFSNDRKNTVNSHTHPQKASGKTWVDTAGDVVDIVGEAVPYILKGCEILDGALKDHIKNELANEAVQKSMQKWDVKNPIDLSYQKNLNDILAYNDIRLTEDQRRQVGLEFDIFSVALILQPPHVVLLATFFGIPGLAEEDRKNKNNFFNSDVFKYFETITDFPDKFNGMEDIYALRDKRKLAREKNTNELKPGGWFTRKTVDEPVEFSKWKKVVEEEYTTNGKYLNEENSKKLDMLLDVNKIKVTSNRRLRLEKQCAINLKENSGYFDGWILDLNFYIETPNNDIIRNMGDVWKSRRNRAVNSDFSKKNLGISDNDASKIALGETVQESIIDKDINEGLFESRDAWLDDHERTELRKAEFKDNQRAFNAHRAKPRTISLSHILLKIMIDKTIKVVTSKPVVNAAKNCCNFFISKIMQPFEKTPEISFDISKYRIDINNIIPGWQNNDGPQDPINIHNKTVLKLCLYIYSIIQKPKKVEVQ